MNCFFCILQEFLFAILNNVIFTQHLWLPWQPGHWKNPKHSFFVQMDPILLKDESFSYSTKIPANIKLRTQETRLNHTMLQIHSFQSFVVTSNVKWCRLIWATLYVTNQPPCMLSATWWITCNIPYLTQVIKSSQVKFIFLIAKYTKLLNYTTQKVCNHKIIQWSPQLNTPKGSEEQPY